MFVVLTAAETFSFVREISGKCSDWQRQQVVAKAVGTVNVEPMIMFGLTTMKRP